MGNSKDDQGIDLNTSAQSAADRLVEQVRRIDSQWTSLPIQGKWSDGKELLANLQTSAELLARQIKHSFDTDQS